MKLNAIIFNLIFLSNLALAQNDSIRSETHVFWSQDYRIQIKDFQDTIRSPKNVAWCENNSLCWGAYAGLFSVMDIPKKKKDQKTKEEVIYFAPAFELKTSYRLTSDSLDYLKQLVVFDMYELAARTCRMRLDSLYKTSPSIGLKAIYFKTVESNVNTNLSKLVAAYTNQVYFEKLEGSYVKWRTLIDELLNEYIDYQTSANDRIRFILNKPIIKGYIRAPKVMGNLFEK